MGSKTLEQKVTGWYAKNPLRAWRKKTETTIATVASALGKSAVAIGSYERGEYNPNEDTLLQIAFLIGGTEEKITEEWIAWLKKRPRP